jgi:predicted hydrocarbon binding protein
MDWCHLFDDCHDGVPDVRQAFWNVPKRHDPKTWNERKGERAIESWARGLLSVFSLSWTRQPPRGGSMFKEERDYNKFKWEDLGDIERGRPNLGSKAPVLVYRLLQYTFRDTMIAELGVEKTNEIIIKAGRLAGMEFCQNILNKNLDFNEFVSQLQAALREQAIGILRIEKADLDNMMLTLTVEEDLDCSGLPPTDEVVCQYDEGFIAGIMETYTGRPFLVREIDCWSSGDRVCRFDVRMLKDAK